MDLLNTSQKSDTILIPTKWTVPITYTHFDTYLLHGLVLVHKHQGEQLCQLLEKPNAIMAMKPQIKIS